MSNCEKDIKSLLLTIYETAVIPRMRGDIMSKEIIKHVKRSKGNINPLWTKFFFSSFFGT